MKTITRSKIHLAMATIILTATLVVPAAPQNQCQGGQYLRGSIAETRIASPNEGRLLGNVTGVLNGASTVYTTGTAPNVTSFDTFLTTQGDMLTATGRPTRTPIPGAPPGEFTVHVDLTITGGSGKYAGATGWMTFDGQGHNAFGGVGANTADLVYTGCVSGPNIKADGNQPQ